MSDILGISSGAISAYQRALSTVSNNIANVNTEGYSRQDVVLKDSAPKKLASMYVGTGVMLQNIRRQYDEFAESNLRNSNSDLSAQTPMVDYTKRVMDIMGDKSIGLSSALDDFFNAAGSLSADPASTVLRTSFLRSADGVASRFGELSGQLDLIATETKQGLKTVADKINTLTSQLALINQSMSRSPSLEGQPPELLDRRDLTLRQLSQLVRTKISFSENGSVTVSLGSTMTQGVVVQGLKSRPIGMDPSGANTTDLILDPYGATSEPLTTMTGGEIGGYQTFISQVLEPAQKNLNNLAKTFVAETNTIQKNGIDGYGQIGQDLFAISPTAPQAAAGIKLAISDGKRVATAAQFRVSEGNTNVTTTRATVKFDGHQTATPLSNNRLVNNPHPSAGVMFKVDGNREYAQVTSLAAGVKATFYMDGMEAGQNLQVLTRDGRQLLGQPLTETQKYQMLMPANGFEQNATYSDKYLNQIDPKAYRGLDYFYGAKGEILYKQNYDNSGAEGPKIPLPASLDTSRIDNVNFQIPAQALMLNNVALQRFVPLQGTEVTLQNAAVGNPPSDFTFNAVVGGTKVSLNVTAAQATSLSALASQLNAQLQAYGLNASLIHNNQDILVGDSQGRNISGVSLTALSNTGTSAQVKVSSAASQMARWINGVTKLDIVAPNFSAISFKLGGISYAMSGLDPSQPGQMAANLQSNLRQYFGDQGISVDLDNGQLHVVDEQGRELTDLNLTPATAGANPGVTSVTQSTVSQTNVRAEVFSEVRAPLSKLQLDKPLKLNGQVISGFTTPEELAAAINAANIGLTASLTPDAELLIENKQGSPIEIGITAQGNALNINAGSYGGQVRMTQVYRDLNVSAATVDMNQPLAINGQVLNEAAYDVPASLTNYKITSSLPPLTVSGSDATSLAAALNADSGFKATFKASVVGNRLVIRPHAASLTDDDIAKRFSVSLGAQNLTPQTKLQNLNDVVDRINSRQADTGVVAKRDLNGDLILSTTDAAGRGEISVGPGKDVNGKYIPNMLGIEPLDYNVTRRLQAKLLDENFTVDPYKTDIRMTFGTYVEGNPPVTQFGDPAQLAKVGLRTAAYIETQSPDDLLVFVTGKGQASVAVGYDGQPANNRDLLRSQSLMVKFTAPNRYSILDAKTGTELADRQFDPTALEPKIEYQGLSLTLSTAPQVGDSFKIDGNFDGLGNNVNALDMVALGKKPVNGDKTLHDTYIDQVNDVGNLSQQAQITQAALKVVNEQATQARDKVSGVNMDEEAAALVRYQQAYQAAAKAMQVAGQLFDAIVQIR
jgi:flagellar hook-associated protein FlgK